MLHLLLLLLTESLQQTYRVGTIIIPIDMEDKIIQREIEYLREPE